MHPAQNPSKDTHNVHLGPDPYIADWLSRQKYAESKDKQITDMQLCIKTTDATTNIHACMTIQDAQKAMLNQHTYNYKT